MIYFLLPRLSPQYSQFIDYIQTHDDTTFVSNSLCHYLYDIKERINHHQQEWDIYKKITNPYEYIHTPIHLRKKCIANYKPLSRSFFKMIELSIFFKKIIDCDRPIKTFHLAEGPGGFIEAIVHLRSANLQQKSDSYTGMTILSDEMDPNIPAWKKSAYFLKENPNVTIETGRDGTGNIISLENFRFCAEKYGSSMDIITGDGGFDFSVDFNNQEHNISQLLFSQIAYALVMQKQGGTFILKIFDSFMQHTVDLLAILAAFYEQVYITKPQTSRYANSEKYVVCTGFIGSIESIESSHATATDIQFKSLFQAFEKMCLQNDKNLQIECLPPGLTKSSLFKYLNTPIPHLFITKVAEYNSIFGQQQIENIHYTLSLIENRFKTEKIDSLVKVNIQKCIQWCIKYNIPYNNIPTNTNIFLSDASFSDTLTDVRRHSAFIR